MRAGGERWPAPAGGQPVVPRRRPGRGRSSWGRVNGAAARVVAVGRPSPPLSPASCQLCVGCMLRRSMTGDRRARDAGPLESECHGAPPTGRRPDGVRRPVARGAVCRPALVIDAPGEWVIRGIQAAGVVAGTLLVIDAPGEWVIGGRRAWAAIHSWTAWLIIGADLAGRSDRSRAYPQRSEASPAAGAGRTPRTVCTWRISETRRRPTWPDEARGMDSGPGRP
jgi:hypothetical protein